MPAKKRIAALARLLAGFAAAAAFIAPSIAFAEIEAEPIPRSELKAKCGLDPDVMAGVDNYLLANMPYVVFRNGHYCWKSKTLQTELLNLHAPKEVWSVTKSFGGILVGIVASRSSMDDTSLLTDWLTPAEIAAFNPDINPQARVAHVMAMTSTSPDLGYNRKVSWTYDAYGEREIDILLPLMDRVIQREPDRFWGARNSKELAVKLFGKLGMRQTTWDGGTLAFSLHTTPEDLARLAELILRKGRWNNEVLVDEKYMYRMTHASFEDSNRSLGYLLYGNTPATSIGDDEEPHCAPYPRWPRYPHAPFFQATGSHGGFPFGDTTPTVDDGVVWAGGTNSTSFAVHRGLDMVIGIIPVVGSNRVVIDPLLDVGLTDRTIAWANIRPALVATLPEFNNNEQGFCHAYRLGAWSQMRAPWSTGASL